MGFGGFDLKTIGGKFGGLGLKTIGDRFTGLGLKTGGASSAPGGVESEDTRRHHEAYIETKRNREYVGFAQCTDKDSFTYKGYLG
jgi:hypothetical protein